MRFIDKNTLVIVDPTDVCKPHSYKMENLSLVRDASRSSKEKVVTTRGCQGCMAVACKSGSRRTVPLDLRLWSSTSVGHKGENDEVPEFFLYAHSCQGIAFGDSLRSGDTTAGIKRAFVRYGNWVTKAVVKKKDDGQPTLPRWDELPYLGVG